MADRSKLNFIKKLAWILCYNNSISIVRFLSDEKLVVYVVSTTYYRRRVCNAQARPWM